MYRNSSRAQRSNQRYVYSGLSQRITLDGVCLDIVIFRPYEGGGWKLTVINPQGKATISDAAFATDWAAFAAFEHHSAQNGAESYASNDNVVAFPHQGRRAR